MEIKITSHSKYALEYHLVFVTKYRNEVLEGPVEVALKKIVSESCGVYGWDLIEIGIMPDHVHLVLSVPPTTALVEVARTLKSLSAVQLFASFPTLKSRKFWGSGLWSPSTFYGSVGTVTEDTVKDYVATQKERK